MVKVFITFHFLITIILVVLILLQKSGEDGSLFSKANQNRVDKVDSNVIKITMFFIAMFIINSIAILYTKNSAHMIKIKEMQSVEKKFNEDL